MTEAAGTGIEFQLSSARPALAPPSGGHLIAHVVVNVEYWRFDQPMPRAILTPPHGVRSVPDVPNFGWAEYGLRCGMPRIFDLVRDRGIPVSASMNAGIIDAYPSVAEAVLDAGWEVVAHGVSQSALTAEDDEAAVIAEARSILGEFAGVEPRGWLSPGLQQSFQTAALVRQAGFDYLCDWILDDLPVWLETASGRLVAVPYTLELNDSLLHAVEHHPSDALPRRLRDTLDTFDPELEHGPRIVTIGLHPHLIGVPHRIGHLAVCLDLLRARDDVVFMTGAGIADWFVASSRSVLGEAVAPVDVKNLARDEPVPEHEEDRHGDVLGSSDATGRE
jgi:peptidoglycan/xylan/chitin deacetylase (PgdA/CDA1 family)